MKRSRINALLAEAKAFFATHQFHLPPWAFWAPADWAGRLEACSEVIENGLGWDLTDFGSGDFAQRGLIAFTIRNGTLEKGDKPYGEKILIVGEGQETPWHFHWSKMEDIINRGGGNLVIDLHNSTDDEQFSAEPVTVSTDGMRRQVEAGGSVTLTPGESICLPQKLYHRFYGQPGRGRVLVGEVSTVNDDATDNRFHEPLGRFPAIDEDEPLLHLLVSDYATWFKQD